MGVYDTLEALKKERDEAKNQIASAYRIYKGMTEDVRTAERNLKKIKSLKNSWYKEWTLQRRRYERLQSKIRGHGSQVREWVKKHPLEGFE